MFSTHRPGHPHDASPLSIFSASVMKFTGSIILFTVLILMASSGLGLSATIRVPEEFPALQDAIKAARNGDTVLVGPGTYRLFFDNLVIPEGKFTLRSSAGPVKTKIMGRGNRAVITIQQRSQVVIDGFTITTESESDMPSVAGGGIHCGAGSAPVIKHNIIMGNRAMFGAGIFCDTQSTPVIEGNLFAKNSAKTSGGAIFTDHARAIIRGNRFHQNSSGSTGGAIGCNRDSSRIYNNILWENRSDFGGAISCDRAATWIYNNTIVSNKAAKGGGIMIDRGSVRLCNLILFRNSRGDLFLKGTGTAGRPQFSDLQTRNFAGINGNISADPKFVDLSSGNFHLLPDSPCIDSGNHDHFYKDRDGSYNDMGAYGGPTPLEDQPFMQTPVKAVSVQDRPHTVSQLPE